MSISKDTRIIDLTVGEFQEVIIKPLQQAMGVAEIDTERYYNTQEALNAYRRLDLAQKGFKKIHANTLLNWEDEKRIINYGSPRNKKYKESELIAAMKTKGMRKAS